MTTSSRGYCNPQHYNGVLDLDSEHSGTKLILLAKFMMLLLQRVDVVPYAQEQETEKHRNHVPHVVIHAASNIVPLALFAVNTKQVTMR